MQNNTEQKYVKLNISITLLCRIITIVCGIVVPKILLDAFGSEAYGATASITQFLAYITLIEGGIGGVARAALYKPLSENDVYGVSLIMKEIRHFFTVIAFIFAGYVILLAVSFKQISNIQIFDWISTFWLVIVISIATFAQYFIGISNSVLLYASQKTYVVNAISLFATIINVFLVFIGIQCGLDLIAVKLLSSLIYTFKPIAMLLYVKKNYSFVKIDIRKPEVLKQKWTGLGQHIAYFLHNNTDTAILTLFVDLPTVAVYSVYNMVVSQIQNLILSFSAGMEALFGDLLAKKDFENLHKWFDYYERRISIITITVYSTASTLIVPFVMLYTEGLTDGEYSQPLFAVILILAAGVYCLRMPYHAMTIAAGHFKETQTAAYGEAVINIVLSFVLVHKFRLSGVAAATLIATLFRFMYYAVYISKKIYNRSIGLFLKRTLADGVAFFSVLCVNNRIIGFMQIGDYAHWILCGLVSVMIAFSITLLINALFYPRIIKNILRSKRKKHSNGNQAIQTFSQDCSKR